MENIRNNEETTPQHVDPAQVGDQHATDDTDGEGDGTTTESATVALEQPAPAATEEKGKRHRATAAKKTAKKKAVKKEAAPKKEGPTKADKAKVIIANAMEANQKAVDAGKRQPNPRKKILAQLEDKCELSKPAASTYLYKYGYKAIADNDDDETE